MATFFNQATLSYNGNVTTSNITTGELLQTLVATKTAVKDTYAANDDITYVISIVNSGTTAFTGLTLTDNLGAYAFNDGTLVPLTYAPDTLNYFVNGVLQSTPAVTAGPPLVISGITIPAGGNATIIYEAALTQFAPLSTDSTIKNEVTISGNGVSSDITAEETVTATDSALLTISKALSPSTVSENGTLTYTFTIQNLGNAETTDADDVTLTDTFDPILNNITVTFNGTSWSSPTNYTYDETTGEFATVAGQISVPAATYTQDSSTGAWITTPGISTLIITGTV